MRFVVICKNCKRDVMADFSVIAKRIRVYVEPCSECLTEAFKDGYEKGCDETADSYKEILSNMEV